MVALGLTAFGFVGLTGAGLGGTIVGVTSFFASCSGFFNPSFSRMLLNNPMIYPFYIYKLFYLFALYNF